MKLQMFGGGLANRLAPQLLQQDQGVVYTNIDNATGILSSVKDKVQAEATDKYAYFYTKENIWLSAPAPTDFLEFQGVVYVSDRIGQPQKYSNGAYNNLGITPPSAAPTVSGNNKYAPVTEIKVEVNDTIGDLPPVDLSYIVVVGSESAPYRSQAFMFTVFGSTTTSIRASGSLVTEATAKPIGNSVETLPDVPARSLEFKAPTLETDAAFVYRYYKDKWRYVGRIRPDIPFKDRQYAVGAAEELDWNDVTVFNGTYSYVYTFYNSNDGTESAPSPVSKEIEVTSGSVSVTLPSNSSDPQVTHKRLYRVGGNIAEFTLVVELPATTTTYIDNIADSDLDGRLLTSDNYYAAPEGLKYLSESYAMLFGAVGPELRFTPIGKPNAWPPEYSIQFDSDITGIGAVSNGVLVMTRFKTYIVTGTGPLSLAQQSLRGDQGCISHDSISPVALGQIVWVSEDGLCTSSGNDVTNLTKNALGEIKLDPVTSTTVDEVYYCALSNGTILAWDYRYNNIPKLLDLGVETVVAARSRVYGWSDGFLHELFASSTLLPFEYKSPRFIEGSSTEAKTYKKVYIRSEGDIIINILIDDVLVATKALTGKETHVVQVPQNRQRGYYIQFEISGVGEVLEIEYDPGRRQDG